jgi:outer membrane lipoprotein
VVYCGMRRVGFGSMVLPLMFLPVMLMTGCGPKVIPKEMESQVDRNVSFLQVKETPEKYKGRTVVFGGEVLSAKRAHDHTRIEVLQIPLDSSLEPVADRTTSLGRFLAVQKEFLDPATVPAGTLVTIVGDVVGTTTLPLDDVQYIYPTLAVRHLKVWERIPPRASSYPAVSIGIGGIFGF